MRFAVGLPNLGDYGDPRLLAELAREAEQAGWDGAFLWDHLVYKKPGWQAADPYVTAGAIAAQTERIRLGVLVTPLSRRRPWKVARETATLDVLSGGRLITGFGLGSQGEIEFAAFGDEGDPKLRGQRLDEALEIVAGLWSGEPFSHRGEHFTVDETVFLPRPLQQPRPPVWIAGRWPKKPGLRRAARWDGVFPTFEGPAEDETPAPRQVREAVEFTLEQRGGSDAPFDVAIEVVGGDPAAYEDVGVTWWIEKLGWFRGSPDEMRTLVKAGPPR